MPGLGKETTGNVTQPFGPPSPNVVSKEPAGWAIRNAGGWLRYRKTKFLNAIAFAHFHPGTDRANAFGTPILAVAKARILQAGTYEETGEHYLIYGIHKNANGKWDTVIFSTHLKANSIVHPVGATVSRGGTVARMGASGMATGPHDHTEVRHSFAADPGPVSASTNWFKYNLQRLQVGGDMANVPWIVPNF